MSNQYLKKNALVIVSGHFNPLHHEHVRFLNRAKRLGKELVVILNNDYQVELKGSKRFLNQSQRKIILENLRSVDRVIIAKDKTSDIRETLSSFVRRDRLKNGVRLVYFVNHANSVPEHIAEEDICKELWIIPKFLKGKKTISSSKLKQ